uniref:Uncharacterized protein n=1 Tax=Papio anubis TaxID=9555 RepID=A0A8I5R249_PAPAN
NPVSTKKYKKLAGRGGGCLWSQLLGRLRRENGVNPGGGACSELRSGHCTPAWATEPDSVSKKKKKKKKKIYKNIFYNYISLVILKKKMLKIKVVLDQIFSWSNPITIIFVTHMVRKYD